MSTEKSKFGNIFKVKDEDVFSELDQTKPEEQKAPEKIAVKPPVKKSRTQLKTEKATITAEATKPDYKRVTVYVTKEQAKRLKKVAAEQETDVSSLIRSAIDKQIKE